MTAFGAAFDNIRLIRKNIPIEQATLLQSSSLVERDAALARIAVLSDNLIRAVSDFADLGYEVRVAAMIAQSDD